MYNKAGKTCKNAKVKEVEGFSIAVVTVWVKISTSKFGGDMNLASQEYRERTDTKRELQARYPYLNV